MIVEQRGYGAFGVNASMVNEHVTRFNNTIHRHLSLGGSGEKLTLEFNDG